MKYKNDIAEIIDFARCSNAKVQEDFQCCLNRFTEDINDEYLRERAKEIIHEADDNSDLIFALKKLARNCNNEIKTCDKCNVRNYCNHYIKTKREQSCIEDLSIIDLFCGAGGLSLGFKQEGFVTVLANDIEECCIETYAHNHPETPRKYIVKGDIREVVDHLEELVAGRAIDVVVGGPPCQGFSMANRQRIIDDPRNFLYKNYVEVVHRVRPKFFVMENVKGMINVADQVVEDFKAIGYEVSYKVLNAKDFGVPQSRERLIYIGNRLNVDNERLFKEIQIIAEAIPNYNLGDAIFGLKELKASREKNSTEKGSDDTGYKIAKADPNATNAYINMINDGQEISIVCNHKARYNNDRDIEIYARLNPGDKSDDPKIADIMPYKRRNGIFKDKYFKLDSNKVCKTITAHMKFDCNMYIHPSQARGLTPREAARVQSYPDDYFFKGAYTKTYMQIGNSVPPLLGRAIAQVVKQYVKED